MALSSINPYSGEVLESFEEATPATLERVLAHAWQAFLGWRERTFAERAACLREVARVAHHPTSYPPDLELGLQDSAVYDPGNFAWSNGAHACELETSLYLYLDRENVREDQIRSEPASFNEEGSPFNWVDLFGAGPATLVSWTSSYTESEKALNKLDAKLGQVEQPQLQAGGPPQA